MFSSAPSLCSFLFQCSFPISLAPSVCRSVPTQPPDLFFSPDRWCIRDDLCLRFPSTLEFFSFGCSLTVTSAIIRLTFLRRLRGRPVLFSVKESDSGHDGCLVLTGPLTTERHRLFEVMSSESLQLATEAAMAEEDVSLYSLVSSKLDSEASIQHRLCSSGKREDSRQRFRPLRRRICRRCRRGLRTISSQSSPSLLCSEACSRADTRSCTNSSIMVLKIKNTRGFTEVKILALRKTS